MRDDNEFSDVVCLVPAAGMGSRLGGDIRKALIPIAGKPLLLWTCEAIAKHPAVTEIIVAVHPDDMPEIEGPLWPLLSAAKVSIAVKGGRCRAESVWNMLEVIPPEAELIAIHDAARPFLSLSLFEMLMKTANSCGAAVPILPLTDTLKRIEGDDIIETVSRKGIVRVQTT